jgi:nucleotidyltransferase/DNA polymerase involved in DNA repair
MEGPEMKVACVRFDRFAAVVEVREQPGLESRPFVIGGYPSERKPVFECSAEAAELGVAPGMTLRQAQHLCPDAVFLPLDRDKYLRAFDEVVDVLDAFSPTVETDTLGRAFIDITGMERLFGPDERLAGTISAEVLQRTRLEPRIGVGSSKFVAATAAAVAPGPDPAIVRKGREREFLAPLPADLLPVSGETKRRLDLLGLRTLGQIASLPPDAVSGQFGREGVLAHKLAGGVDERPLVPRAKPSVLEDEVCGDGALETVDSLLAALGALLDRLVPALRSRNQVCGQVRLCFHLNGSGSWHESLTLKEPTDSKRDILSFMRNRLETVAFPADITGVRLGLAQLGGERGRQDSLFSGERARREERLRIVVKHLQTLFGSNPLRRVVPVDPCSRIPERRSVLMEYNPW